MKKGIALFCCLVMLVSMISVPALAEEKTTYYRLYEAEASTLNYLKATTQVDQTIPANVIDTLVEYDTYGNVIPGLATEWTVSQDGLVWTLTLRQGEKWLDYQGNEVAQVTAHDFVSSAKYVLNPAYESDLSNQLYFIKNAQAYYNGLKNKLIAEGTIELEEGEETEEGESISFEEVGVKALDDYTLEYTLEKPTPYFLSALTYVCFMPAYGPLLEELGTEFGASDNSKLYYCGAYYLSEFEPQVKNIYTKNEKNWDADQTYIDEVVRMYNPETLTLDPTMALRGEVDYALI
ncbi:MAG: peptide ABC transporter substrate-binding protein, partial [Clostridiales bacterium]|nr:peptide ABC transporter substrate-binding protein [Clostridiales bacterium]